MNKKDLLTESLVNALHSKGKMTESVDWDYYNKFEEITDKYMSNQGEGDTLASQIVTAINKLVYKWYNDGDVYDNVHSGLSGWANDLSSYANWLYKYCEEAKPILYDIYGMGDESDYETLLQELADACLNEEFLKEFEKPKQGSIYNCDGPFEFSEYSEDEEEEDYYDDDEYLDSMDESKKCESYADLPQMEIYEYLKTGYLEGEDKVENVKATIEAIRDDYPELATSEDKENELISYVTMKANEIYDGEYDDKDEEDELYESRVHRTLSVGDTFQNENGVSVVILDVDDKNQVTYRFSDGKTECHPMESVNNMLNENGYTKLNESKEVKSEAYTARDYFEANMKRYLDGGDDRKEDDIKVLAENEDFILTGARDEEYPSRIYLQVTSGSYRNVEVFIDQNYKGKVDKAEINWSALGSVDVSETEEFIKHLQLAIEFCKEIDGKDYSNEIK